MFPLFINLDKTCSEDLIVCAKVGCQGNKLNPSGRHFAPPSNFRL